VSSPSASPYYKTNLSWPLSRAGWGFTRVTLVERVETALVHLAETKRGAYYADPEYGTIVYRLRTQNNTDSLRLAVVEDLRRAAATYVPDAIIHDMTVETIDSDESSLRVSVYWTLRGMTTQRAGGEPASKYNIAQLTI
jgi:phage baseplate assembly protein W